MHLFVSHALCQRVLGLREPQLDQMRAPNRICPVSHGVKRGIWYGSDPTSAAPREVVTAPSKPASLTNWPMPSNKVALRSCHSDRQTTRTGRSDDLLNPPPPPTISFLATVALVTCEHRVAAGVSADRKSLALPDRQPVPTSSSGLRQQRCLQHGQLAEPVRHAHRPGLYFKALSMRSIAAPPVLDICQPMGT